MDQRPASRSWTEDALAALWQEHRGWVAALLYAHAPRPNGALDVNDLLQEVAVSLVANIHRISSPEKIAPWLRTVAINVARDAGRRSQVRRNMHNAGDGLDSMLARPSRETASEDSRERGRRALEIVTGLPLEYREPLLLNMRGLSQRQIAEVMELPVSTVETRIFRARAMVRAEMESEENAEETRMLRFDATHDAGGGLKVSSER